MASDTTIAFVAGSWHSPECFKKVAVYTEAAGFTTRLVGPLPSVGQAIENPDDDRAFIHEALLDELDNKKGNVILVVHSYGGMPGSNACAGLAKQARADKHTAVIGTVFITVSKENNDPGDVFTCMTPESILYNDCTQEDQAECVAALVPHSYNTGLIKARYEVWKDIPSVYLVCELDQCIPPSAQRMVAEKAQSFKDIGSIQSGHSPFINKPKETAEYIINSAKKYFV